ncbi:MAG TPA: hypothetical protein VKB18_09320 [Gemmatimonadota bacterium]|nr:hypothetical protein [Gemmatimonadota bacterium]
MEFFEQLRQRHLFRVVVGFLAAGWIALQVVDQLTSQGILPDFAYDLTLVWSLAGMPIAFTLGWYHGEKGAQHVTRREMVLLVLFVCLGIAGSVPVVSREMRSRMRLEAATEGKLDLRSVAVLYFADRSPGDSLGYLADGFTESLIDELSTVPALHVVSRNGVARFRGADIGSDSIARALGAGTLVEGSITPDGGRIRVSVSLVDGESGAEFQNAGFERPAGDLLAVRDELSDQTARLLRQWLGEEVELRRTRDETRSVPAWALYQRADRKRKDALAALEARDGEAAFADFDEADSLAARAALVDSTWAEVPVLRARVDYLRAKVVAQAGDFRGAVPWIEEGLAHVAEALAIDPNQARAMEWRGSLRYLRYLLHLEPDPDRQQALLDRAREDLQRAVELNPRLASGFATLSHLYTQTHETTSAVLAARRAFEEDAYLENADVIVWRIFWGSYNLGQFTQARHWCDIGRDRFPDQSDFATCELVLMTTPAGQPDPSRAWSLVAKVDSLAPERKAEWEHLRAEILAGGVLARSGLADSARRVLVRARDGATTDVDETRQLHLLEGYMRTLVGDTAAALDEIELWAVVNPGEDFTSGWWFDGLRGDPRFERIVAQAAGSGGAHPGGTGSR